MDPNQFDARTTRLVAHLSRRRGLGALIALGLAASSQPETTEAGKKRKKKITICLDGHTKKVKKRKYQQKYPGATVGACPRCTATTCAAEGRTCGPLADGCGRTLACGACGTGDTPSCRDTGTCVACSSVCPPACGICVNRSDGTTTCGESIAYVPTGCGTDADCSGSSPTCVSAFTSKGNNVTNALPPIFGMTSPGLCASITPC